MNIDSFHPLILNVGKAVHDSDWNWSNVCSAFARIYYVVQGEAAITVNGQTHSLRPGHLYLIPPFTTHSTACNGRFIHYYIHVYEEEFTDNNIFEELELPFEVPMQPHDGYLFERLVQLNPAIPLPASDPHTYDNSKTLFHNILQRKMRSDELKMESRGLIYQLFSRFLQKATAKSAFRDERITRAIHYIMNHLSDPINLKTLAAEACVSPEYLIRLFKNTTGTTPVQYITRKRIEKAQHLLSTTNIPIKHISYSLGFNDSGYFLYVFKRALGVTPLKYREQQSHI